MQTSPSIQRKHCTSMHGKFSPCHYCRGISPTTRSLSSSLHWQERLHGCRIIAAPGFSSLQTSLSLSSISFYFRSTLLLLLIIIAGGHTHATINVSDPQHSSSSQKDQCPENILAPKIVALKQDADLKVLVPNILSLRQFVNCSNRANVTGYCIDVFHAAIRALVDSGSLPLNLSIHYTCFDFPSNLQDNNPTYNDMIELVANGTFDAVVGDITIGHDRSRLVDFTQKYMESGIVIIGKLEKSNVSPWTLFIQPFQSSMWGTILVAFASTGLLICYLESNDHPQLRQGNITHRIGNILWFIVEALILLDRHYFRRTSSRAIMIAWLFFAVLLGASYTAGLSSFLTYNDFSQMNLNILSLESMTEKIGYRKGSIVKDIISRRFNIADDRFVPLRTAEEFSYRLRNKVNGVVAVLDEIPYANIILSDGKFLDCQYGVVDTELVQQGFGFGFYRKRDLANIFSIALANLTENGCLQNLTIQYGMNHESKCSSDASFSKVQWKSALTIFIPLLLILCVCVTAKYVRLRSQTKHQDTQDDSSVHLCGSMTPSRYAEEEVYRNELELMKLS
ncbi:hypothetical protein KP509_35G032300 [Ceratopteris richardii]|uniref:Ionotropic glutamate receptor C-terminal domain-containing protein n=1 Tax=Ceratopteris richardii TaxID=49495 RepID=A0A8T2QH23_CERRI|nr:hypothetical protein KP509_35G032300 [Ceratopteris richardii]